MNPAPPVTSAFIGLPREGAKSLRPSLLGSPSLRVADFLSTTARIIGRGGREVKVYPPRVLLDLYRRASDGDFEGVTNPARRLVAVAQDLLRRYDAFGHVPVAHQALDPLGRP